MTTFTEPAASIEFDTYLEFKAFAYICGYQKQMRYGDREVWVTDGCKALVTLEKNLNWTNNAPVQAAFYEVRSLVPEH